MKKFVCVLFLLLAGHVNAALVNFADRTAFEEGLTAGLSIEDFEDVTSINQVLSSVNIEPGVTFSTSASGPFLTIGYSITGSYSGSAIGVSFPTDAGWVIDFSTPVNAVGLDVFLNSVAQSTLFDIAVFGENGLLGSFEITDPAAYQPGFFGVFSDSDWITRVTVHQVNNTFGAKIIDNVAFGQVSAVPAPAAVWLFGVGLLTVIGFARRKA